MEVMRTPLERREARVERKLADSTRRVEGRLGSGGVERSKESWGDFFICIRLCCIRSPWQSCNQTGGTVSVSLNPPP